MEEGDSLPVVGEGGGGTPPTGTAMTNVAEKGEGEKGGDRTRLPEATDAATTASTKEVSRKDSQHPDMMNQARNQKTPLGANRYLLLTLYCVVTFLTGSTYWGWNGMQDMLYKSGAFLWECKGTDMTETRAGNAFYPDCPARQNAINNMYTAAFASHFIFSALAGVVLDWAGPKACIIMGQLSGALGWGLIGASSRSVNAYYAGATFLGISADPGYLPLLSISNLFPGNESLVMSITGSIRSCSFAIPVILSAVYNNSHHFGPSEFWKFCVGYIALGLGLSFIIALLFVPCRPFVPGRYVEDVATSDESKAANDVDAAIRSRRVSYTGPMQPPISASVLDAKDMASELRGSPPDYARRRGSFEQEMMPPPGSHDRHRGEGPAPMTLKQTLMRPEFLLIVPFFCMCLIRGEFFTKSNKEQLRTSDGNDVYIAFSIFNILSFIPGPLFGKLSDRFGILVVIKILNTVGILMYVFLMPDLIAMKGIAVFFFFIYTSFVLSNLYCYVGVNFPAEHFGKVTGVASMVGGAWTLSSIGWYQLSSSTLPATIPPPNNFLVADSIMILFGFINIPLWIAMWQLSKKRKRQAALEAQSLTAGKGGSISAPLPPAGNDGGGDDAGGDAAAGDGRKSSLTDLRIDVNGAAKKGADGGGV